MHKVITKDMAEIAEGGAVTSPDGGKVHVLDSLTDAETILSSFTDEAPKPPPGPNRRQRRSVQALERRHDRRATRNFNRAAKAAVAMSRQGRYTDAAKLVRKRIFGAQAITATAKFDLANRAQALGRVLGVELNNQETE